MSGAGVTVPSRAPTVIPRQVISQNPGVQHGLGGARAPGRSAMRIRLRCLVTIAVRAGPAEAYGGSAVRNPRLTIILQPPGRCPSGGIGLFYEYTASST